MFKFRDILHETNQIKASLRLRLFCIMKYMHQYKQKKKEKDEYFGFVAFFLLSLI